MFGGVILKIILTSVKFSSVSFLQLNQIFHLKKLFDLNSNIKIDIIQLLN